MAAMLPPDVLAKYEPVIGLEVHVQFGDADKDLLRLPDELWRAAEPECLSGLPWPSRSIACFEQVSGGDGEKAGLALNCTIRPFSRFVRENYFYPDLPKGDQISQYDQPLAEHGWVDISLESGKKRIGVTRVHMEDDAGKRIHYGFKGSDCYSYVDLNRSGTPVGGDCQRAGYAKFRRGLCVSH